MDRRERAFWAVVTGVAAGIAAAAVLIWLANAGRADDVWGSLIVGVVVGVVHFVLNEWLDRRRKGGPEGPPREPTIVKPPGG